LPEIYPCDEGAAVPFIESNCQGQEIATCKPDGVNFAGFMCVGETAPGAPGMWEDGLFPEPPFGDEDFGPFPPHPYEDLYPAEEISSPVCTENGVAITNEGTLCEKEGLFVYVECFQIDEEKNEYGFEKIPCVTREEIERFGDGEVPPPDATDPVIPEDENSVPSGPTNPENETDTVVNPDEDIDPGNNETVTE